MDEVAERILAGAVFVAAVILCTTIMYLAITPTTPCDIVKSDRVREQQPPAELVKACAESK